MSGLIRMSSEVGLPPSGITRPRWFPVAVSAKSPIAPPKKGVSWLKIVFLSSFILCGLGLGVLYAYLRELPDLSLLQNEPSQSTRIYDVNGQLVSQLCLEQRTLIPLSRVPQALQEAVLATEDVRFYKHWGIDFLGIFRAFLMNIRAGRVVEGGSTITQQLARNLFLTREQTIARKAREALLSLQIERNFTKKQILEMYLNQIYFGQGAYGVESAARTYFGKPAEELSLAECAMLAGMPKAPSNYDPYKNPLGALQRRNKVLNNLAEEGFISLQEATEAKNQPLELHKIEVQTAPYFVEFVRQQLEAKYGTHAVYKGGLAVYTTLDSKMQREAQQALTRGLQDAENVARRSRAGGIPVTQPIQGALMAIDPKTGAIRAMIGGRDYRESVFNRAVQAQRQPGSSFKPIIYAAAIENGYTFADVFLDSPSVYLDPSTNKEWRPANFSGKFRGPTTLHTALMHSINMVTIKLLEKLGIQPVVNLARRMGISTPIKPNLSLGLGTSEATLSEMCAAFNVFVNQGIRVEPFGVLSVKDASGRVLESNAPVAQEVLDPQTAYLVTHTLKDVIDQGTARIIRRMGFNRPAAGKTGTSNNNIDAWFIGYTPDLLCGVWVGYDARQSLGKSQTGGTTAAPIWANFMKAATAGMPSRDFPEPDGLESKRVCMDSGLIATARCPRVRAELFKKDSVPIKSCNVHTGVTIDPSQVGSTSSSGSGDLLEMESAPPVAVQSVSNGATVITTVQPTPVPQTNVEQSYQDEGF